MSDPQISEIIIHKAYQVNTSYSYWVKYIKQHPRPPNHQKKDLKPITGIKQIVEMVEVLY